MDVQNEKNIFSLISLSAKIIMWATLLSGPIGTILVIFIKPQPVWQGVSVFIQNYHWIQIVPFVLGLILLAGSCLFVASTSRLAKEDTHRVMVNLAFISITIYATMIAINYTFQIAVIPTLIYTKSEVIGFLTMANPSAIAWPIEMFGYMFQGISWWLLQPILCGKSHSKLRLLLSVNGVMSVMGAVFSCVDGTWTMKTFGIVMFVLWNVLVIVMMYMIAKKFKK